MITINLSAEELQFLSKKAEEKVHAEHWGRRSAIKVKNFTQSFITEEAFKKLLAKHNKWFRYRGLYVGDAKGAGKDFIVRKHNEEISIGLRCIGDSSLHRWKSMAYPNDRYESEQEMIGDYIIVCSHVGGFVTFHGFMAKTKLLKALSKSPILVSRKNSEKFRTISLTEFSQDLEQFIDKLDGH